MFEKGDVYTIDGSAIKWVGVVTSRNELGGVGATEMAYQKESGQFIAVDTAAYFNVERPGQRVLLQAATKEEVENV
ncbi:hypothetical protein LCGC14_1111660 [marine sediment metagenome]|uniref:Uncharacterized protein n=2 Tax=marine sediment metagenome TaxID=412755 RepID=A0A0F9QCN1_9ZZZZ